MYYWLLYTTCSLIWSSYWLGNFISNKKKGHIWEIRSSNSNLAMFKTGNFPNFDTTCYTASMHECLFTTGPSTILPFHTPPFYPWLKSEACLTRCAEEKLRGNTMADIDSLGFAIVPSTKLNSIRGHLPADSVEDRHVLAVSETLSRNRVIVNFPWSVCGGSGAISNLSRRIGHSWFYFELIRVHFLSLENVLVWWDLNANDAWSIRARRNFEWRKKIFPFISPFILLRKEMENFLYLLFSAVLQILYS